MTILYRELGKQDLEIVSEDTLYGKNIKFWRPLKLKEGWHCLGDTVTVENSNNPEDREPKLAIFYPKNGTDSEQAIKYIGGEARNINYYKVGSLKSTEIWVAGSEEGYRTIGLVATPKGEKPNPKVVTISQVKAKGGFLEKARPRQLVYGVKNGRLKQGEVLGNLNKYNNLLQAWDSINKDRNEEINPDYHYQLNTFLWINEMEEKEGIKVGNFWLVLDFEAELPGRGPDDPLMNFTVSRRVMKSLDNYDKERAEREAERERQEKEKRENQGTNNYGYD